MKELDKTDISLIKQLVEEKFGQRINYSKDCLALSIHIFEETNRQVSTSTLKRFWGIVHSQFNPSSFTLDSLALYVGYADWNDYMNQNQNQNQKFCESKYWTEIKERYEAVSANSLYSLKKRIGIPFENTTFRSFAKNKVESFLLSDKTATAFIAPGGYGKSTVIANLIDSFFMGEEPLYPNDIVLFFDFSIIDGLLNEQFNLELYLNQLLGYDSEQSVRKYFQQNPEEIRGRIVFVIDGLNEISKRTDKINIVVDNVLKIILTNEETTWFKIILACRSNVWNYVNYSINQTPTLRDKWFDVVFDSGNDNINNIPLLEDEEINQILANNNFPENFEAILINNPELAETLKIPFFLQIYINYTLTDNITSDIDLFTQFLQKVILDGIYGEEKLAIIESIVSATHFGLYGNNVLKNKIQTINENPNAYFELVSYGFIYEYKVKDRFLLINTFLSFSHENLFEFILAVFWIRSNELNLDLFEKVVDFYAEKPELQRNILIWFIKYSFSERKTEIIKSLHSFIKDKFIESENPNPVLVQEMISCIGLKLRSYPEIQQQVLPWFSSNPLTRRMYFESFIDLDFIVLFYGNAIDLYLKESKDLKDIIYGNYMKMLQYFLSNNNEKTIQYAQNIVQTNPRIQPGIIYEAMRIAASQLYFYLTNKQAEDYGDEKIDAFFANMSKDHQTGIGFIQYSIHIILSILCYCERFEETVRIYQSFLNTDAFRLTSSNVKIQISLVFYAYALHKTGKTEIANQILMKAPKANYQANSYYYQKVCTQIIECEFLFFNNRIEEVKKLVRHTLELSQKLQFKYFENKAIEIAHKLLYEGKQLC